MLSNRKQETGRTDGGVEKRPREGMYHQLSCCKSRAHWMILRLISGPKKHHSSHRTWNTQECILRQRPSLTCTRQTSEKERSQSAQTWKLYFFQLNVRGEGQQQATGTAQC